MTGTLAFTKPSTVPGLGTASQPVTFTPGDTTDYNTVSTSVNVTVNQAGTSVGVASSENPSGYQDCVIFTATLPSDASGSVMFLTNSVLFNTEGLSGGSAKTTNCALPRGTNTITAQYAGDSNYIGSTNDLAGGQVVTNHPPVAAPMTVTRTAGTVLTIALADVATNWSDADGDTVTLSGINLVTTNGVTLFPINLTTTWTAPMSSPTPPTSAMTTATI